MGDCLPQVISLHCQNVAGLKAKCQQKIGCVICVQVKYFLFVRDIFRVEVYRFILKYIPEYKLSFVAALRITELEISRGSIFMGCSMSQPISIVMGEFSGI